MVGRVLDIKDVVIEDQLGCYIGNKYVEWENLRSQRKELWEEVARYVYATDTTSTTNSKLPWKNKTTIPKICQIYDNLYANYMASLFPKRKWLRWEASDKSSGTKEKREAIINYANHMIANPRFKEEISKLVSDYIQYGNCFVTTEWQDDTQELKDKIQTGYVGPVPRRISPLSLVMNPTASDFTHAPKIVRTLLNIGDVREIIERETNDENKEAMETLWDYLVTLRKNYSGSTSGGTSLKTEDALYAVDGFSSFQAYLASGYVEVLTFYGDYYDYESDTFKRNHIVSVADRHKVIYSKPNPSFFGTADIFHCGWRRRRDNLWAMGPLENLIGMQYRIDHIENLKADCFDLLTFPPIKVRGYVEDFTWAPMEKIYIGDEGDVEIIAPPFQVLQANVEIQTLENKMEEMAGAPKEALGFRTPGEKTAYEVQRLENAASRIFQNKIVQFEEQILEPLLNAMIELARRNLNSATTIGVFDDELKSQAFKTISPEDITGNGRIRPIGARHFAEKAERIQNISNFYASGVGQDQNVRVHFSGLKTAQMVEDLLDLQEYEIVTPFVAITEQADAQRVAQTAEEQVLMETQTPSGLSPDDYDQDILGEMAGGPLPEGGGF